jgi:hypothetical protein
MEGRCWPSWTVKGGQGSGITLTSARKPCKAGSKFNCLKQRKQCILDISPSAPTEYFELSNGPSLPWNWTKEDISALG